MREQTSRDRRLQEERDEKRKESPASGTATELPEMGSVNLNVDHDLMRLSGGP